MPENNTINLDKIDKKIMRELERDSRQPYSHIAGKAGVSVETVKYRVERLKHGGVISRMLADPDLSRLGLKTFRLYLKMGPMPERKQSDFLEKYANRASVQWLALCEGGWDYIVRFSLHSEEEFKVEVEELMHAYGRYVRKKSIALGAYQEFLPLTYLLGSERGPRVRFGRAATPVKLDEKDYRILYCLYEDARTPTTEIARKLKITPEAVQYRLRKLASQDFIKCFTVWYDQELFGFQYYKVFFWLQNITPQKEQAIVRYCESLPNVIFLTRVIGDWDLEVDLHARNPLELRKIVSDITGKHSGIVSEHASVVVLKNFVPNPLKQFL